MDFSNEPHFPGQPRPGQARQTIQQLFSRILFSALSARVASLCVCMYLGREFNIVEPLTAISRLLPLHMHIVDE